MFSKITTILILNLFLASTVVSQEEAYNYLLKKHVNPSTGDVNYCMLKEDKHYLDTYLNFLAQTSPTEKWSISKEKAFWMNVYNAYVLKIIIDNYPFQKSSIVKQEKEKNMEVIINYSYKESKKSSILSVKKEGKSVWEIPFVNVGSKVYTLNQVEHEIIRKKFKDPRIHAGFNSASKSSPKVAVIAFTEKGVDEQLEVLMKGFINDTTRNIVTKNKLKLSKIFEWYEGDFTQNESLIDYINKYVLINIQKDATISYMEYNWNLNDE
ncbi:DUF547 domain-containing protein [Tenacibaculum sp. 190524A02b]|uniref:DUF547 domain-containing protein n=1 Tax=Tenacibaculum vairaonense TaxID=3137860 RepID=A0ABM9PGL0_9FLAO